MGKYTASIAQLLSTKHYHAPIGAGISREAYYSPKHQVVFKVDQGKYGSSDQMRKEIRLINKLTEEEKEIFPVIEVEVYKKRLVLVMKRAQLYAAGYFCCDWDDGRAYLTRNLNYYCEVNRLTVDNIDQVVEFIVKYKVKDVHRKNIGVIGTKLVIIDMGF